VDDHTALDVPETTAQSPMGLAVLPEGHRLALSPLNRRRWQSFKANRRGYWALWIFLVLFVVSLFAELIAND
jgi:microcin C transport system permease protein